MGLHNSLFEGSIREANELDVKKAIENIQNGINQLLDEREMDHNAISYLLHKVDRIDEGLEILFTMAETTRSILFMMGVPEDKWVEVFNYHQEHLRDRHAQDVETKLNE